MTNEELVKKLVDEGYLRSLRVINAFKQVDRQNFVPEDLRDEAYVNAPLPIGFGQTISQPLTVAFMLELLQPQPGDKVLDVGAGSGWQAALLAHIVYGEPRRTMGPRGKVYALEIISELKEFGEQNVKKLGVKNIEFFCADARAGLAKFAPFNKIIGAAASHEIPPALLKQLAPNGPSTNSGQGRIVFPVDDALVLGIKSQAGKIKFQKFPGFRFVPLVSH